MGYPLDLDEMSEIRLVAELAERKENRAKGLCDYCHRSGSTPSCKMSVRHDVARATLREKMSNADIEDVQQLIDQPTEHPPKPRVRKSTPEDEILLDALAITDKLEEVFTNHASRNASVIKDLRAGLIKKPEGTKALVITHLLAALDLVANVEEVPKKKEEAIEKTVPIRAQRNPNTNTITPLNKECPLLIGGDVDGPICRNGEHEKCTYFRGLAREKHTEQLYTLCAEAHLKPVEGEGEFD